MAFIIGFILVGLFFFAMHYFTEFNNEKKIAILIIILSIMAVAVMYNEYTKQENQKMLDATLMFKQGKTLRCDGKDINSTNYTLSIGTYTFIGKKGTPNYAEMIGASTCE